MTQKRRVPKVGDKIEFKEGEKWREATITGRGCKASNKKTPNYFNIRKEGAGAGGIDLVM